MSTALVIQVCTVRSPSPPTLTPTMRFLHRLIFLYLAYHQQRKNKTCARRKHSRYRKDFFRSLSIKKPRRRYRKIPRCALIPLKLSPWQKLLALQNDQAYITMMGFDCKSFSRFLRSFVLFFLPTHRLTSWA